MNDTCLICGDPASLCCCEKTILTQEELLAYAKKLKKDSARLDWLDTQGGAIRHESFGEYSYYFGKPFKTIRETIDDAQQEEIKQ